MEPEVIDGTSVDLKWNEPDEDGLIQFMCAEKQFRYKAKQPNLLCCEKEQIEMKLFLQQQNVFQMLNLCVFSEDRIRNGCKKIMKSRQGSTQGRLDTFFTVTGSISSKRKVGGSNY